MTFMFLLSTAIAFSNVPQCRGGGEPPPFFMPRNPHHSIRNFMLPQKYVKNFALAKKIWILQPFPQNISRQYFPLKITLSIKSGRKLKNVIFPRQDFQFEIYLQFFYQVAYFCPQYQVWMWKSFDFHFCLTPMIMDPPYSKIVQL